MKTTLPLLLAAVLTAPSYAQLKPGTFLAVVGGSSTVRGVFAVDRFANTATRMNIAGIPWASVAARRVLIEDANNFLLLTAAGTSHVFRVTWSSGAWRATPLTTNPPVVWAWDFARIGKWIYFTRSKSGNGCCTTDGEIWRLPATGGTPTLFFQISKAGIQGIPNVMTAVGTDLHIFMWVGPTTTGTDHISVSTATPTPTLTKRGRLPHSKAYTGTAGVLPREAKYDARTGLIVIGYRTSDVLWRLPSGLTVRHDAVNVRHNASQRTWWGESLAVNTDTGAVLVGDGNGGFEEKICLDGRWRLNVQALPSLPSNTFVISIDYLASGSLYRRTGAGCKQANGQIPCNYVTKLPIRGTANFAFTVVTPSRTGLFVIGARQANLNLFPLAPGCVIGPSIDFIGIGVPTATGLASPSFTIPANLPKGAFAYVQWAIPSSLNTIGHVFSDTRYIKP